jgi:hypothetical protein
VPLPLPNYALSLDNRAIRHFLTLAGRWQTCFDENNSKHRGGNMAELDNRQQRSRANQNPHTGNPRLQQAFDTGWTEGQVYWLEKTVEHRRCFHSAMAGIFQNRRSAALDAHTQIRHLPPAGRNGA